MKNQGLEETISNNHNTEYVNLKKPESRLLESEGRYFISHSPSASIVPVDKKLASFIVGLPNVYDGILIQQLQQLLNYGVLTMGMKQQKIETVHCVSPPIKTLIFHVNQECNLRCIHCYIEADPSKNYQLDGQLISHTITDFAEMGGLVIDITGGEPLLRKDIFNIFYNAKNSGLHTNLLSNGTNITKNTASKIKDTTNRITISLDGLKEAHDSVRGRDTFDQVSRSLDNLSEENVSIGATTMLTYMNLNELGSVQDFLLTKGVKYWNLVLPRRSGRFKNEYLPDKTCEEWFSNLNKYYAILREVKEKAKESNMEVVIDHVMIPYNDRKGARIDNSLNHLLYNKGRVCWDNTITILPNGDVKGCLFIDNFVYGNLNNAGLKTIYTSKNRKETIERFKQFKGEKECPIIPICNH